MKLYTKIVNFVNKSVIQKKKLLKSKDIFYELHPEITESQKQYLDWLLEKQCKFDQVTVSNIKNIKILNNCYFSFLKHLNYYKLKLK